MKKSTNPMKTAILMVIMSITLSCTSEKEHSITPTFSDWYTVQSPTDDVIQGVWGNYDSTLLIATTYAIFSSKDQGENWQQVLKSDASISGIISNNDTLFATTGIINKGDIQLLASANLFSVDNGINWKSYTKYNPLFDEKISSNLSNKSLYTNSVYSSTKANYKINQVYIDDASLTTRRFETPGVISPDNSEINLPNRHQIRSLYIDNKNRLYINATDAICGRNANGFEFCNSKNGRGIIYISKSPVR